MRNKEYLLQLFDRIASGKASEEEILEYNRWCNAFQENGIPITNMEEISAGMLKNIRKKIQPASKVYPLKLWTKIAAAASVIIALTLGGYYLFNKEAIQTLASDDYQNIQPGSNQAILTLANGQSILLDSTKEGQLASQGSSKITKVSRGLLTYNSLSTNNNKQKTVLYNTLKVPRGGQYRLVLPDGTHVWLNAASSITFPTSFTGSERRVSVTGEVYMEVAEDAKHPFIVTTNKVDVTVLGTHFNIMAYENEPAIKTTLLEGAVKVSVRGESTGTVISPGQQAIVDGNNRQITVKKVDAATIAAWIHGFLSLKYCSVQEFMNQLSRWYDVDIEYSGQIPEQRFGGMIDRNAPLTDMLSALNAAGIHTRLEGKKIIVLTH